MTPSSAFQVARIDEPSRLLGPTYTLEAALLYYRRLEAEVLARVAAKCRARGLAVSSADVSDVAAILKAELGAALHEGLYDRRRKRRGGLK